MIYVFGDYELDTARCALRRTGEPVTVEPKVFNVLAYLMAHRDRVVTKDELLERFWPGAFMSGSVLTRCLAKARKAVHDDSVRQHVIKTVRGHGYHFVAAVTVRGQAPPAALVPVSAPEPIPLPAPSAPADGDAPTTRGVGMASART